MAIRDTADALRAAPAAALADLADQLTAYAELTGRTVDGRRLSATASITGDADARLELRGTPAGPWVWITDGTRAHAVGINRKPGRGGRRVLMLAGASHPVMAPVAHPGGTGRDAWRQVQRRAAALAPQVAGQHVHQAVTRG